MSDSIQIHQGTGITQVDIASELPAIFTLARALTKAPGFIPQHLKNEGEIAAVVLAGRELGLQPMVSLRSLSMIKGKVVLAADVMLGLMIRAGAKVEWLSDGSNGKAQLQLTRPGHEPYVSTFTIDDAKLAGLASNDNYKKHQGAMLRARAVSAAARAYMPDVLSGTYVPGELEEDAPVRAAKPRRSLDDVAGGATVPFPGAASTATTQTPITPEPDAVTGELPYGFDQHMAALPQCSVDALQAWVDTLPELGPTASQKRTAWLAFQSRCAELEVDANSYVSR